MSEAAVVGRPHPMLEEVPVAFVIADPSAGPDLPNCIIAACDMVTSLPRATLDKVAKAERRKIATASSPTKAKTPIEVHRA